MSLMELFRSLEAGTITTIAGAGYRDGVPARDADAGWPLGVVRRPDGDLIVNDYKAHRIWRIDGDGILHTFAGDGVPGDSGDGGPAIEARVYGPHDLTQDKDGNLYFSDLWNSTYRRIDYRTGIISRLAGSGRVGRGGDGGPALEAEMNTTSGVAVDKAGNIYISGEWDNNVRRIDAETGIIETFAGLNARHYPSERGNSRPVRGLAGTTFDWEPAPSLKGYHGDGGPAAEAAFHQPEHLAFDPQGDLYVCDNSNNRIRKIDMKTGMISTVLGNGLPSSAGDGGPAAEASTSMPDAICIDAHGNLYVGEKQGFRVRKVDAATGIVTTLVGTGVPGYGEEGLLGQDTRCNSCESGIWADPDGTVFWSDCSGRLRRYDGSTGVVTTVLGGVGVHDGGPATDAYLSGPGGVCAGPDGQVYIADIWNHRIRAIDPASETIRTVVGNVPVGYRGWRPRPGGVSLPRADGGARARRRHLPGRRHRPNTEDRRSLRGDHDCRRRRTARLGRRRRPGHEGQDRVPVFHRFRRERKHVLLRQRLPRGATGRDGRHYQHRCGTRGGGFLSRRHRRRGGAPRHAVGPGRYRGGSGLRRGHS